MKASQLLVALFLIVRWRAGIRFICVVLIINGTNKKDGEDETRKAVNSNFTKLIPNSCITY